MSTERLYLSEAEAYLRITVSRAAREHPVLLTMLQDGRLHLTGIAKLAPFLSRQNRDTLLERATHRSKRQIEELVAELSPRPDAPNSVRRLPDKRPAPVPASMQDPRRSGAETVELRPDGVAALTVVDPPRAAEGVAQGLGADVDAVLELGPDGADLSPDPALLTAPPRTPASGATLRAVVQPLSPARYKVQFTASAELRAKLERLQALMRSQVPDGDLAAIIELAITEKLERLEARRYALTSAPRKSLSTTERAPASRHVPAAVRRAVRERDGDRCGFVDERGRRCTERDRLEFHHRHPFGLGGDHSPQNIGLLCRAHNAYLAGIDYGTTVMSPHLGIRQRRPRSTGSSQGIPSASPP